MNCDINSREKKGWGCTWGSHRPNSVALGAIGGGNQERQSRARSGSTLEQAPSLCSRLRKEEKERETGRKNGGIHLDDFLSREGENHIAGRIDVRVCSAIRERRGRGMGKRKRLAFFCGV